MILALLLVASFEGDYAAATALARQSKPAVAAEAFLALSRKSQGEPRSKAIVAAANLYAWELGDRDRAIGLYDQVIAQDGASPASLRAIRGRLSLERERGAEAELELCQTIFLRRPDGEHAPYLLLRAAEILGRDLDRPKDALLRLERLVGQYPSSTRVDDARMLEAELALAMKDFDRAIQAYRAIVKSREASLFFGEYDSKYVDDAYLGWAKALEAKGDLRAAEERYISLSEDLPKSRLRKEALRAAARLADQRGDTQRATRIRARALE